MKRERSTKGPGARRGPAAAGAVGPPGGSDPVSFVILLWLEPRGPTEDPEWRWRVKRAQTGEEAYFRRVRDLLAYVAGRTGIPAPR